MNARTRLIKPDFFLDEDVASLPPLTRLLFVGLWTLADRDGRIEDRPARIKAQALPYDGADVDAMLDELAASRLVIRYEVDGRRVLQIRSFARHQKPHHMEPASTLPPPPTTTAPVRRAKTKERRHGALTNSQQPVSMALCPTLPDPDPDPVSLPDPDPGEVASRPHGSRDPSTTGLVRRAPEVRKRADPEDFTAFWVAYPRRVKKSQARQAWLSTRAKRPPLIDLLNAVDRAKRSAEWQRDGGRYIPNPASWLNGERWSDELEPDAPPGPILSDLERNNIAACLAVQRRYQDAAAARSERTADAGLLAAADEAFDDVPCEDQ